MNRTMKRIEEVLDTKVRPEMASHGGGITVDHLENKVLYVKLQGQCAGCMTARILQMRNSRAI